MSLYFEERIDEEKLEEPLNGKITFMRPFIFTLDEEDFHMFLKTRTFRTTHDVLSISWFMNLTDDDVAIGKEIAVLEDAFVPNCACFVSYKLFYDNDMRFGFYSSNRVAALWSAENPTAFITPDGFMTRFRDAKAERRIKKIVVFVEIILPTKFFNAPFKYLSPFKQLCHKYPTNMEKDFRFAFLKKSDYSIKCLDGKMPALKCVLNVTSRFMEKHFAETKDIELIVEHRIDVINLLIFYLHSGCFEMPKSFDFDFVERLLKAIDYFELVPQTMFRSSMRGILTSSMQDSLCKKFVEETCDFNDLLRWLSIALRISFFILGDMICTVIAEKYYFKWHQTFPENAQNNENQMFRDVFGSEHHFFIFRTFGIIDSIFNDTLLTKAILD
uniref:BTB domain-containing protein n=1 Tax=Panagrolaimus davidi TaxID=227884 RepID=A0A914PXY5_9BILA